MKSDGVPRKNHMTPDEERAFDRKAEKMFKGQRELLPGRNFLWNRFHSEDGEDLDNYRRNFDDVFPNAPGAGF